jgi:hypothetical protein
MQPALALYGSAERNVEMAMRGQRQHSCASGE